MTNKNFPKPIDKLIKVWYNNISKGEDPKKREVIKMFVVERLVDGQWYYWGRYETLEQADDARTFLITEYNLWARVVEA